jgi:hypothetical protein
MTTADENLEHYLPNNKAPINNRKEARVHENSRNRDSRNS